MDSKVAKSLFSLSETDQQILVLSNQINELEDRLQKRQTMLDQRRARLVELEGVRSENATRHKEEEQVLRDEEQRIVDRRKQLTAIGGAKAAKLVERELDIASRALQAMEERVGKTIEEIENIDKEITVLREDVSTLETELSEQSPEDEKELVSINKDLKKLEASHEKYLSALAKSLQSLYQRVSKRYPGDAVALAVNGACRSCYRALPAQTYNQVIAGNSLIQCPGCSRILVHADKDNK